jgi:two-component system response regulator PilR (NtrC family)
MLVQHFLDIGSYNKLPNGQHKVRSITREAMVALQNYPWPGNVRELVNVVERAISFCDTGVLDVSDLPDYVRAAKAPTPGSTGKSPTVKRPQTAPTAGTPLVSMDPNAPAPAPPMELLGEGVTFKDAKERWVASFERDYILQLLRRNTGNISHAARAADIDRKYFRKLMKKYDIEAAGVDEPDEAE